MPAHSPQGLAPQLPRVVEAFYSYCLGNNGPFAIAPVSAYRSRG
jgi:hypothetical protein